MRVILFTFAALAAAYSVFLSIVPPARKGVTVSQEALNRQTVERYRYRIDAPVVIVGSSLAARFASSGDVPCIYDLSIAGGSALTGLEIVRQTLRKPRILLIETNLIDRPIDERFAVRPLWFRRFLPLIWVENSPVSRLLTLLAELRGSDGAPTPATDAMLAAPLLLQQATYDKPITRDAERRAVADLRRRINAVTRDGVQPILFEMPVHPSLEQRVRARQMRAIVANAFPDVPFVRAATLTAGTPVRTTDGVHLDENEASRIFERLLAATRIDCGK